MIVVDTSVWTSALRRGTGTHAKVLRQLLDADEVALPIPVRIELLSGASNKDRPKLRRALSALPMLYPTEETWPTVERWVERAAAAGERFAVGDLLIGALTSECGAIIWSLDGHFERMERLGLLQCYTP